MLHNLKHSVRREGLALVPALLLALAYVAWAAYWTPDHWYRLDRVFVADAVAGQPVQMTVKRTIVRDFEGRYSVKISTLPGHSTICSGGSEVAYEASGKLPDPLTLEWWTYGARPDCMTVLRPGLYSMLTCITIEPNGFFLGPRRTCKASNVFAIKQKGG